MTPSARVAAAIEILDTIQQGLPAEQVLTRWARGHRFAGSKDRAAIRDHVFDVLRRKRSAAVMGRGTDGRALMLGILRLDGADLETLFSGEGYGSAPLSDGEAHPQDPDWTDADRWNLPDWLLPQFKASLGDTAEETAMLLQGRAPVTLRVNISKTTVSEAILMLSHDGVEVLENPRAETALTVTSGARKVRNGQAYLSGFVELQDASSQALVEGLPKAERILDFCAGGGGKALAIAARMGRPVFAHDLNAARMQDIPVRAARADAEVTCLQTDELPDQAPFDLVVCDAPCSGSGAWRRSPEGKWTLTAARLAALNQTQESILEDASRLVAPGGTLVYATCSVLNSENEDRIEAFLLRHPDWKCTDMQRFSISPDADGFFGAHLTR